MSEPQAAQDSVSERVDTLNCLHCGLVMAPAKRRGRVKLFCCAKHRVAYRDAVIQAGLRRVEELLEQFVAIGNELERVTAQAEGALQLLQKATRKGTRVTK